MRIDNNKLVTVFGGSGFLGRYVVHALASRGHRIRVATRRPDLAYHLQTAGRLGQIQVAAAMGHRSERFIEIAKIGRAAGHAGQSRAIHLNRRPAGTAASRRPRLAPRRGRP